MSTIAALSLQLAQPAQVFVAHGSRAFDALTQVLQGPAWPLLNDGQDVTIRECAGGGASRALRNGDFVVRQQVVMEVGGA